MAGGVPHIDFTSFHSLLDIMALFLALFVLVSVADHAATVSKVNPEQYEVAKDRRYLLYGVNPGEGFNLRRDVYMRAANFVRLLREKGENFVLVLPPWGGIYHWKSLRIGPQSRLRWSQFFDVPSLNRFVPVIELEDFFKETGEKSADIVYYLQHYEEGWSDGKWEEKWDMRPCIDGDRYYFQMEPGEKWYGWFWGYSEEMSAKRFHCVSVQGHSSTLVPIVLHENNTERESILIDRFETVMHDNFGDRYYWEARRSMRYAKSLIRVADEFRKNELDSTDDLDQTIRTEDWREMTPKHGTAKGGPYLAIHWRRRDFLHAHGKELPSIEGTAKQVHDLLKKLDLNVVFLSTDAPRKEVDDLRTALGEQVKLKQFRATFEQLDEFKDGGVSIIDQWIAAHARYFTGSHVSTFSFRIQDDREILGFSPNTTFNRLCPDNVTDCEQPAQWKIVYDSETNRF